MDGLETLGLMKHVERPFSQKLAWIVDPFHEGSIYIHLSFAHVAPPSEVARRLSPFSKSLHLASI